PVGLARYMRRLFPRPSEIEHDGLAAPSAHARDDLAAVESTESKEVPPLAAPTRQRVTRTLNGVHRRGPLFAMRSPGAWTAIGVPVALLLVAALAAITLRHRARTDAIAASPSLSAASSPSEEPSPSMGALPPAPDKDAVRDPIVATAVRTEDAPPVGVGDGPPKKTNPQRTNPRGAPKERSATTKSRPPSATWDPDAPTLPSTQSS